MDLVQCPGVGCGCVGACVVAENARVRGVAVFVGAAVLPLHDEVLRTVSLRAVGRNVREIRDLGLVRRARCELIAARFAQSIAIETDVVGRR